MSFKESFEDGFVTLEIRGMQHAIKQHISAHLLEKSERISEALDRLLAKTAIATVFEKAIEDALAYELSSMARRIVVDAVRQAGEEVAGKVAEIAKERLLEALKVDR